MKVLAIRPNLVHHRAYRGRFCRLGLASALAAAAFWLATSEAFAAPIVPDAFGYDILDFDEYCDSGVRFRDISGTGTALAQGGVEVAALSGGNLDDGFWQVTFPFPFDFYGNDVGSAPLYVSTNGFVTFDSSGAVNFVNTSIPDSSTPNAAVFGFWDDLSPNETFAGIACGTDIDCGIYSQTVGAAPHRRFIVQYEQVPFLGANPDLGYVRFQIVFFEATGNMRVLYAPDLAACAVDGCQRVGGGSASIGLESADPANGMTAFTGLTYSENTASLLLTPTTFVQSILFRSPTSDGTDTLDGFYRMDDDCVHPAHGNLFTDISGSGTPLAQGGIEVAALSGGNLDDGFWEVTFPFPFSFYGNDADGTPLYISANGFVTFDTAGATQFSGTIPNVSPPNAAVFGFWDDLDLNATAAGIDCGTDIDCGLYTAVIGSAPNRRFIVQYEEVPFLGSDPDEGHVRFQISFLEASGEIRVDYAPDLTACAASSCNRVDGNSAAIGIESANPANPFGTPFSGLAYSENEPALLLAPGERVQSIVFHPVFVHLAISKIESVDPVIVGDNLTYTVTLTNNGPAVATNVMVSEAITLSAGTSITSITAAAGSTYLPANSPSGTWTIASLGVNASTTLTVVIAVSAAADGGTDLLSDTATVTDADQTIIDTDDDTATLATSIRPQDADLGIEILGPASVAAGLSVTYTVNVMNAGPGPGLAVVAGVTVPAGLTWAETSGDCVTAPPCALGDIAALASRSFQVRYLIAPDYADPEPVVAEATVASTATPPSPDTDPMDDQASTSADIVRNADLSLIKAANPSGSVSIGSQIVFTLTVTNAGPATANATVTDLLPEEVTYISNDCGASEMDGTVTWNVGLLAPGDDATCHITVAVVRLGAFANAASVTPDAPVVDPTPEDNEATAPLNRSSLPAPLLDTLGLAALVSLLAAVAARGLRRK